MARSSASSNSRSLRVRRHVFGRARDGYTTLSCSADLSIPERRELECFEFGEAVEWRGDPNGIDEVRFLLRPISAGVALTRVAPGPPDPSNRATLLLRTLIFDRNDAGLVASNLNSLLRDASLFAFEGSETDPISVEIDRAPLGSVRPDLIEMQQTASARRGGVVIPFEQTSFAEVTALVAQIYARSGQLPRVVYRPGSDELDCDVMVIDDHCRRGNASQLRISYPEGRSESPRSSGRRPAGSNFDPRTVVVPREFEVSTSLESDMKKSGSTLAKMMALMQFVMLVLLGFGVVTQLKLQARLADLDTEFRSQNKKTQEKIEDARTAALSDPSGWNKDFEKVPSMLVDANDKLRYLSSKFDSIEKNGVAAKFDENGDIPTKISGVLDRLTKVESSVQTLSEGLVSKDELAESVSVKSKEAVENGIVLAFQKRDQEEKKRVEEADKKWSMSPENAPVIGGSDPCAADDGGKGQTPEERLRRLRIAWDHWKRDDFDVLVDKVDKIMKILDRK